MGAGLFGDQWIGGNYRNNGILIYLRVAMLDFKHRRSDATIVAAATPFQQVWRLVANRFPKFYLLAEG
jgi:hypothetical protein